MKKQWNLFINYSYQLACNQTFTNEIMNISDVLPRDVPFNQSINTTLFGSGFEIAICKQIICQFGEKQTNGIFNDLNEIICPTPLINENLSIVSISLVIDNKIIQSGIYFQFVSSLLIIDDGILTSTISSKTDQIRIIHQPLIITVFILLFTFIL